RWEKEMWIIKFDKSAKVAVDDSYAYNWIEFTADTTNDRTYKNGTKQTDKTIRLKGYTNPVESTDQGTETFTVTYTAIDATNVPDVQTKTSGVALKLSTTVPVRSGHNFLGWSTTEGAISADDVNYYPGQYYTLDAPLELYAVFEEISTPTEPEDPVTPSWPSTPGSGMGSALAGAAVAAGVVAAAAAALAIPALLFFNAIRTIRR
ncbi:MAG: InlB B-repeat-containing protein, partial [Bacillota bacterium]|nr:InlB B-repeat-containing protein [Bacillota bacterium]